MHEYYTNFQILFVYIIHDVGRKISSQQNTGKKLAIQCRPFEPGWSIQLSWISTTPHLTFLSLEAHVLDDSATDPPNTAFLSQAVIAAGPNLCYDDGRLGDHPGQSAVLL